MTSKDGIRNHLQAEELASAMKTVAFYHSIWSTLTTIAVRETNQTGYSYMVCYREQNGHGKLRRSFVVDEMQLHAELFHIITEHYMEK